MRKGIALSFLVIFMFSHTELHQFLKIPVLFEHLAEHRLEDPSITFFQFLRLHYEKIVVDDDYQRDQQLPFRDTECALVLTTVTDVPPQSLKFDEQEFQILPKKHFPKANLLYSHAFTNSVFQPPRKTLADISC